MASIDNFEPLFYQDNFIRHIGPLFQAKGKDLSQIGLLAGEQHCNGRGIVHGGVIASLADTALAYAVSFNEEPPLHMVTASLTTDFIGMAKDGDFIIAKVEIKKIGKTTAFARADLLLEEKVIATASAVFNILHRQSV